MSDQERCPHCGGKLSGRAERDRLLQEREELVQVLWRFDWDGEARAVLSRLVEADQGGTP